MSETQQGPYFADVVELTTLLQCLGFSVKAIDTREPDQSRSCDGVARTVVIDCQMSGYHVVLENRHGECSCPSREDFGGVYQIESMSAGKRLQTEYRRTSLGSLPRLQRERLAGELRRLLAELSQDTLDCSRSQSHGALEAASPDIRSNQLKVDSPLRYRSLDALTRDDPDLPTPGSLEKVAFIADAEKRRRPCMRQATYTVQSPRSSTSGTVRVCNKTSSPIHAASSLLDTMVEVDRAAKELQRQIALAWPQLHRDTVQEDSIADLGLDVSKISLFKATESSKFVSSPNLSGLSTRDDFLKTSSKYTDISASTSKLDVVKEKKVSKLRRLSPNFFKAKKDAQAGPGAKNAAQDDKNKLRSSLFKPRIVQPVRTPTQDSNANISTISLNNKKKFSHVKSTIPRPSPTPIRKEY